MTDQTGLTIGEVQARLARWETNGEIPLVTELYRQLLASMQENERLRGLAQRLLPLIDAHSQEDLQARDELHALINHGPPNEYTDTAPEATP